MKKIVLFFISAFVFGCTPSPESVIKKSAAQWKMIYFIDSTTNVCFSAIKFGKDASTIDCKTFTCVPCDSLKHVTIFKIGK